MLRLLTGVSEHATRPAPRALVLTCVVALVACAGDQPEAGAAGDPVALGPCGRVDPAVGFAVRDHEGVRVVENLRPADGAPVVGTEPLAVIGAREADPDDVIGRLASAVLLADGRVAVADALSREVRIHAPDGAFLQRFGGDGDGPEEFSRSIALFRGTGDTLVVADMFQTRYSRVLPDGTHLDRSYVSGALGSGESHSVAAAFGNGDLLVFDRVAARPSEPVTEVDRPERTYRRLDAATGSLRRFGPIPRDDFFTFVHTGALEGTLTFGPLPFGRVESWAVGEEDLFVGFGDDFEVERHSPGEGMRAFYRICRERTPVAPADLRRAIEERLEPLSPEALRFERPALENIPAPVEEPAHLEMKVDAGGRLWVRDFTPPWEDARWQVFDEDGRWLGAAALPSGLSVLDIGTDRILVAGENELGVETVRVLPLR